jgi:hypothetical protein
MATDAPSTSQPQELCGYPVVETLVPDATYLAIGPGGRGVVLKKLDPDCLYARELHPDVHDRLSRVRELAHTGVANLFGVGKQGPDAWLIWEYLEGEPLAEYAREHSRSPRELAVLVRELVLTVESLHTQGIVHGALQSGNVIVAPEGSVHLTHISPLLYADPSDDADAIVETVGSILDERGERAGPLGRLLAEAHEARLPLRGLAARLAVLTDTQETAAPPAATVTREEKRTRRRAMAGAVIVTAVGVAAAYGAWHAAGRPGAERLPAWLH